MQQCSYCVMLTFRIIFVIRDFVFFIPYCILTLFGELHVVYTVSLVFAMGLNIAIMVIYGKLMSCQPTAYTERTFLYTNGPIELVQTLQLPNCQQVIYQNQGTRE